MNRFLPMFEMGTEGPGARIRPHRGKDVNGMSDDRFRGASVRNLPRPNKTYAAGRVCAEPGCETRLSIYSKWKHCWQHEPVHSYVPRGKRKTRSKAA
jgi:hypothetical protein